MQKRTLKVALLAVLAIVLVMGISGAAQADQTWSDLPDTVTAKYGITDNQVAEISEGYPGGLWRPYSNVSRAQFTKMAVAAFNISLANSALASYTDVPKSNYYYPYVEGAKAAGIVTGTTATTFSPDMKITRQQALAIVARYIAKAQGFDLATMYTADDIATLLAHFGDAASISPGLRDEVAFAFDMGITTGDDYGNIKPLANLTRIQGAALLIRAQALAPPEVWTPAELRVVSTDKTEGLIGQKYAVTFEVTTSAGHPAKGVLVDIDALGGAEFYVGNVSAQAAVTDDSGLVTVDLLSLEPGTQRVTARVAKVGLVYITRYWLALDEVYNVGGSSAQNNAGKEHEWAVRVVVMGPGPRSTSQNDWYNAIDADFDPSNLDVEDGIDAICEGYVPDDGWTLQHELALAALGFTPRTMAGIDVEWSVYDRADNPVTLPDETVTSVGGIVSVDGRSMEPARTAVGKTDADGYSSIKVVSKVIGTTLTRAIAGYAENPYPKQLFDHLTFQDTQKHSYDWDDQPDVDACQVKTWIHHTIGDGTPGPITPGYLAANIGEEKTLTLTLNDQFGNPLAGRSVEWTMQGVGFFQTDDAGDISSPEVAEKNRDFDTTDALGKATLFVKCYQVGEQIIHAKVRDKGTGGTEGAWLTYTAEVQWFDADIVTFDDITTHDVWVDKYTDVSDGVIDNFWDPRNEALARNPVDTSHDFDLHVYGLKLEYDPSQDRPDRQGPYIDSDSDAVSYNKVFDSKDAAYFGGLLMYPTADQVTADWFRARLLTPWGYDEVEARVPTGTGYDYTFDATWLSAFPYDHNHNGIIEASAEVWTDANSNHVKDPGEVVYGVDERGEIEVEAEGKWIKLSFEGAYTEYDHNDDGYKEPFEGVPGIYLPLEGKDVRFFMANEDDKLKTNMGMDFAGDTIDSVASTINPQAPQSTLTDANGVASVSVTGTEKGPVTIKAVVDWTGNPHNGVALATAYAKKLWVAGPVKPEDVTIEIYIDGEKVATSKEGSLVDDVGNPLCGRKLAVERAEDGSKVLSSAHVTVHVLDAYNNDLPDYEVVYLLEDINSWVGGSQTSADTFLPFAFLADLEDDLDEDELISYDRNGYRPDSNEPIPYSDPYGKIVGLGGTEAFFFNQWLGSEKPVERGHAGLDFWYVRYPGMGFVDYHSDYLAAAATYSWPQPYPGADQRFDGFDGVLDGMYLGSEYWSIDPAWPTSHVGLATDGAKAWTLDSYYDADEGPGVDIQPNALTGSGVYIQLADSFVEEYALSGRHLKSILRVEVYAPHDGLVIEGEPLWSWQVHQVWEIPVPTTIELDPEIDYVIAGDGANHQTATITATVFDQFGDHMAFVDVYFQSKVLEGYLDAGSFLAPLQTDENGNVSVVRQQTDSGAWGVEELVAVFDSDGDTLIETSDVRSNKAVIQWVFDDSDGDVLRDGDGVPYLPATDLVRVAADQQRVLMIPGVTPLGGKNVWVYESPAAEAFVGAGIYVSTAATWGLNASTSVTWDDGDGVWLKTYSTDTDDAPNWIYDQAVP